MIVFTPGPAPAAGPAGVGGLGSAAAVPSKMTSASQIDRKTDDMAAACRTVRADVHRTGQTAGPTGRCPRTAHWSVNSRHRIGWSESTQDSLQRGAYTGIQLRVLQIGDEA